MSDREERSTPASGPSGPRDGEGGGGTLAHLGPGFVLEVQQSCARITEDVLALEDAALGPALRDERLQRAKRLLHGLRGSAATLGAAELSALAAELERRLAFLKLPLARPVADALFHGIEQLVHHAHRWASPVGTAAVPLPRAALAAPDAVPGGAALAARLGALQARLERGAEALAQASAGLSGAGLDAQVHAALHEALRALREGSAQARALAGALAPPAAGAPDGEGA